MALRIFLSSLIVFCIASSLANAQRADFPYTDFSKADSVAGLYPKHSLKDLKILADKLTAPFTSEVEKFRAIFRWVTLNIDYDVDLFLKDAEKKQQYRRAPDKLKQWNRTFSKQTTSRMLSQYKTVCSGYAELVNSLCSHAGLSSVVISGWGKNGLANLAAGRSNHAWNGVKLDGRWYLCDATWSAGVVDMGAQRFIRKYSDAYFLAAPQYFVRDHYPSDSSWMLLLKKPTPLEFIQQPLVHTGTLSLQLNTITPNTKKVVVKLKEKFVFTFTSNYGGNFEKASLFIEQKNKHDWIYPELCVNPNGEHQIEHKFTSKGQYRVIVYLNWSPCVEYSVTVK